MVKIFLITLVLMAIAFAFLGIRMLLQKNGSAPSASCNASSKLDGVDNCGCGGGHCSN